MVVVALLIGLLAGPIVAWSHEERSEQSTLTVTGTGRLALAPDTAFVTFGMEAAGKSLPEAQRQNQAVMSQVMERLRELQIEKERIQTASFTVSPQYKPASSRPSDAPTAPPAIIGYVVNNSVTVEVRNLERVGAVIEAAFAAGANHFQGLHWALRDEQQAKLGALKQAAAKAREKAFALSEALKVQLVRVISINEESHVAHPMPKFSRSTMAMDGGGEPPIYSGELKIEGIVTVIYEIRQQ